MASWPNYSWRTIGLASVLTIPLTAISLEIASDDPSVSAAEIKPKAEKSLLLDMAKTDSGFLVVGERGHILTSADGITWQQMNVPTRSTLTTVSVQGNSIWAAGHDGVILYSADSGKTWQRQRVSPWSKESVEITNGSPVLDTYFIDEQTGYAVGAYSLLLKTSDAGKTWQTLSTSGQKQEIAATDLTADNSGTFSDSDLEIGAEDDPHLNAITRTASGALLIMGERGAGFRSIDDGLSWQKIALPYAGSMFGVLSLGGEHVLAYGLRGNVFESLDAGSSWSKVSSGTDFSLIGGAVGADGTVALVGGNGTLLTRQAGGSTFTVNHVQMKTGQTPSLSAVMPTDAGFLLASDLGSISYTVQ
jgi:photosystem II stability/assembly factor-like uncharacterized protein